ncbi:hypothetical protein N658DRAFT_425365 [Parathielavia hyrcaniae]|uniref:Uncharacterized protein n=1 Tax=Parathielavia hyrcaniae TaxID=113614 RepID=A0AAN6T2H1_9PEZI|nr:hypothetical protein N658DRAFT_425365 [Parathielavia hyrcaniae]
MGSSLSTLVGWTVVIGTVYVVVFGIPGQQKKAREAVRGASHRQRLDDKPHNQNRKEPKEKAKRQRGEAYTKDVEDVNKTSQAKARASKPSAPAQSVDYSSDEGVDNREFARQLANVKQGTNLNAPKKSDEKRHKSVKQSRAQIIEDKADQIKVSPPPAPSAPSAPSSTAGADADDDDSSTRSPEMQAADAAGVSDMLEPKAAGPSVLRLTDTDKVKAKKEKKAKEPEKVETKKQRQNRQKVEAAKAVREEAEKQRKVDMEAQRRQARIAEGRPAKDGFAFMAAAKAQPSAWSSNGVNGSTTSSVANNNTNGGFLPVQPLDTLDTGSHSDVSAPKSATPAITNPSDSWIATLPSEEEQMEMLRGEEAWNTVMTKKTTKKKNPKEPAAESPVDSEPTVIQEQPAAMAPVASNTSSAAPKKTAKAFSQKSAFAALSTNDEPEGDRENEWDV